MTCLKLTNFEKIKANRKIIGLVYFDATTLVLRRKFIIELRKSKLADEFGRRSLLDLENFVEYHCLSRDTGFVN